MTHAAFITSGQGPGQPPRTPAMLPSAKAFEINIACNCILYIILTMLDSASPEQSGPPGPNNCTAAKVRRLARRVTQVYDDALAPFGLTNDQLAELLNWTLATFDKDHLPTDFAPFTETEVAAGRAQPLVGEAPVMRAALRQKFTAGEVGSRGGEQD